MIQRKKRQWMMRMYNTQGGLGGTMGMGQRSSTADSSNSSAALNGVSGFGEYDDDAEDGDELLDWTQHLDFDAYLDDWTSMACTLGSEAWVPEDERPYLMDLPAPGGDVRGAMASAGAPLQAFKGGL